jgi:hypothetical protein
MADLVHHSVRVLMQLQKTHFEVVEEGSCHCNRCQRSSECEACAGDVCTDIASHHTHQQHCDCQEHVNAAQEAHSSWLCWCSVGISLNLQAQHRPALQFDALHSRQQGRIKLQLLVLWRFGALSGKPIERHVEAPAA